MRGRVNLHTLEDPHSGNVQNKVGDVVILSSPPRDLTQLDPI
jgi:hypothetical protein